VSGGRPLLLWLVLAAVGVAVEPDGLARSAKDVLQEEEPEWYNARDDGWRRVEITPPPELASEASAGPALSVLPMILYGVIILGLLALVIWLVTSGREAPVPALQRTGTLQPKAALSELPFAVVDTGDPEGALAQALAAGDHRRALIWIYACLLLRLDALGRLRLERSKTNRCYLRELPAEDAAQGLLQRTVTAFEAVYFGDRAADPATVLALHTDYRQLAQVPT
jgi:hypothetical protein